MREVDKYPSVGERVERCDRLWFAVLDYSKPPHEWKLANLEITICDFKRGTFEKV